MGITGLSAGDPAMAAAGAQVDFLKTVMQTYEQNANVVNQMLDKLEAPKVSPSHLGKKIDVSA